ncbi:PilT protein domain protein [Desulfamplus magnetovallimortis]|uniref:PilT protein domain protein n=1 Tax=Desulfamplus magnetovallimortis TaxID=1246637 RepID=A0A1W1HKX2_9BACT|nr:type II toxin-antitoxin system VapC family toxin [Desulfamplus magnetovallimortis]SLM33103.1 PilT protein domain protein [Desulfamplus magnetovallimortis]
MSILLDTQALLWFLLDDPRLSDKANVTIVDKDGLIYVSPASIWEIAIKISIGKYELPEPFALFWERQLRINDFTLLPITVLQSECVISLPFHHRDPFDRLIIAQSLVEEIPVVSSDTMFDSYGVERIW